MWTSILPFFFSPLDLTHSLGGQFKLFFVWFTVYLRFFFCSAFFPTVGAFCVAYFSYPFFQEFSNGLPDLSSAGFFESVDKCFSRPPPPLRQGYYSLSRPLPYLIHPCGLLFVVCLMKSKVSPISGTFSTLLMLVCFWLVKPPVNISFFLRFRPPVIGGIVVQCLSSMFPLVDLLNLYELCPLLLDTFQDTTFPFCFRLSGSCSLTSSGVGFFYHA